MTLNLNSSEKILFSLLRSALHKTPPTGIDWSKVTEDEWKKCVSMAVRHGVVATAWEGVEMLLPEFQPPKAIKLTWAMTVQKHEKRYERYCRAADELSSIYAENGIVMVQLKGVGLSSYYPVPSHREGGDIDIYTYSADREKLSDSEANRLADKLMEEKGIEVEYHSSKHSNFFYKGIPIENHKTFLNVKTLKFANQMDILLHEMLNPSETLLCDGRYKVMIPSPEFNAIFLSFHAGQHYCAGLRIHHLFDWACLLKNYGLPLSDKVMDKKFLGFIYALTNISNELLGTEVKVPCDEKMTIEVYEQLMHPKFSGNAPKNKLSLFFFKAARMVHSHFKSSRIFDQTLIVTFWRSLVFHIRNPKTIFMNTDK